VTEHPIPEQTDELAIRLFRNFFASKQGREPSAQSLADLQPGMAQVWRDLALNVQDVLGIEGVAHAMATMDNITSSPSRGVVEHLRDEDKVIVAPLDAARRALGGAA
jgi:hypothetical protein